jgi:hypothetical protein
MAKISPCKRNAIIRNLETSGRKNNERENMGKFDRLSFSLVF